MKYAAIDIGTNAARLLIGELIEDKGQSSVKKNHLPKNTTTFRR